MGSLAILVVLAGATAASEICPEPVSLQRMADLLDQAESAFGAFDASALEATVDQAYAGLPCLDAVLPTAEAARLHRMRGLLLFLQDQPEQARPALAAAAALEPDWQLPPPFAVGGHPLQVLVEEVTAESSPTVKVGTPEGIGLLFDGVATDERATARSTVLQALGVQQTVLTSACLEPSDPIPDLASLASPRPTALEAATLEPRVPQWAGTSLLAAGGASAIAAGVLYGMAAKSHRDWADSATAKDAVDHMDRNHALVKGSAAAAGAALGLGAGGVVLLRW